MNEITNNPEQIIEILEEIGAILSQADVSIENVESILASIVAIFGSVAAVFSTLGAAGALVVGIIVAVISFLLAIIWHFVQAIPIYKLAKKTNTKGAALALIPIPFFYLDELLRTFVFVKTAGGKEVKIVGKFKIDSRILSYFIWLGIFLFGNMLWDTVMYILTGITGGLLTPLSFVLSYVPNVALAWLEYAFLRDVLDIFDENKKKNNTVAIVVSVIDAILPFRFARTVYLYFILRKKPITEELVTEVKC